MTAQLLFVLLAVLVVSGDLGYLCGQYNNRRQTTVIRGTGLFIEMDCRACGWLNSVPCKHLRARPACLNCRARLMPGSHLVLCHLTAMPGLRSELETLWTDEERLWLRLADHVLRSQPGNHQPDENRAKELL